MPNFTSSLFDSTIISTHHIFSTFDSSDISDVLTHSPGPLTSCSLPSKNQQSKIYHIARQWKLFINIQSIKRKKAEVNMNLIEQSDLSIIMGIETWLLPSIWSAEIFPPNYEIIHKDRKYGYGGVLLAIKKEYIADSIETTTTSEAVFAKLNFGKT